MKNFNHPSDKFRRQILVVKIVMTLAFFGILALVVFLPRSGGGRFAAFNAPEMPRDWAILVQPKESALKEPVKRASDDLTLYDFQPSLGQIYALETDRDTVFIGSSRGLVEFKEGAAPVLHQRNASVPFEWIKILSVSPEVIVTSSYAANGETNGTPVGTYAFIRKSKNWKKISDNLLEHSGKDGRVVIIREDGILSELVVVNDELTFEPVRSAHPYSVSTRIRAFSKDAVAVENAGQMDIVRLDRVDPVRFDSQGALEDFVFDKNGGVLIWREETRSSASAPGLTVVNLERLDSSFYASASNGEFLGALTVGLTKRSIWLGTMSGDQPLIRVDRDGLAAWFVKGVPALYYADAVSNDEDTAWIALCKDLYDGGFHSHCYVAKTPDVFGKPTLATE